MEAKYLRPFRDYEEAGKTDKAQPPEQAKGEQTDPDWIMSYMKGGEPFCILSAYQATDSPEVNLQNHDALEKETLANRYAYHAMVLRYQCKENGQVISKEYRSLFVPEMPFHISLNLAKKYGQSTIAVRSDEGLDFISVKDEELLLSINAEDVKMAWCAFILNPTQLWLR